MLFFDVLPFTDDASVVNGKTSKKSMQKRRGGFWGVYALKIAVHLQDLHKIQYPQCSSAAVVLISVVVIRFAELKNAVRARLHVVISSGILKRQSYCTNTTLGHADS